MKQHLLICCYLLTVLSIFGQTGSGIVASQPDAVKLGSGGQRIVYQQRAERWITVSSLKPFGLQALRINAFDVGWYWLGVTWETGLLQQGDQGFWEQGCYLGACRDLGPTIHLSVMCQLYQRRIAGYTPSRFVPLNLGLSYTLHPDLTCLIEGCREPTQTTSLHVGFEYTILERLGCLLGVAAPLALQNGLASYPLQPSIGFETSLKRLHVAVAWQLHAKLGATSGVTIMYLLR